MLWRHLPPGTRTCLVSLILITLMAPTALAAAGGEPGSGGDWEPRPPSRDVDVPPGEDPCPNANPGWRDAQTIYGVEVQASKQCQPDNPKLVAAFVRGTNRIPQSDLHELGLHEDAVRKSDDRDGDGDPDLIEITLEVAELNGWHLTNDDLASVTYDIAPGVTVPFWVFHPKMTIHHSGPTFFDLARMPSAPIRVEQGDEVRITLENTHYLPHTIHLHGSDHPFQQANGQGNDGVPGISELPVRPGDARTYTFTPRQPGTNFYHCHVQPQVHVMMGLGTTLIVEEDRPGNTLQTFNPGAGHVRAPSKAVQESYDREYDLIYQDVDKELNELVTSSNDPRVIAKLQNRGYDAAEAKPDYFLLNGRSFPYTLRESNIVVSPDEDVKLRVVNAGSHPVSLHTHGHKATITHNDGVEVPPDARIQRDVYTLTASQRLDLHLNTTNDGLNSYGPGVWFMHDHQEEAVTTDGIGPGGDITVITYTSHLDPQTGLPVPAGSPLDMFFNAAYYRGEVPAWTNLGLPNAFGDVDVDYETRSGDDEGLDVPAPGLIPTLLVVGLVTLARRHRREGAP